MKSDSKQPSLPLAGGTVPLQADEDYPELLRELAETVERDLVALEIDQARAAAMAETVVENVREKFGGIPQYWPKGQTWRQRKRRAAMWERFNGTNHAELAREFGMCLQQVYRTLAIARAEDKARRQGQLPFDTNNDAGPMDRVQPDLKGASQ